MQHLCKGSAAVTFVAVDVVVVVVVVVGSATVAAVVDVVVVVDIVVIELVGESISPTYSSYVNRSKSRIGAPITRPPLLIYPSYAPAPKSFIPGALASK